MTVFPLPDDDDDTPAVPEAGEDEGCRRMLAAVRRLVRCDAAALLRLDGAALVPLAVDGLSEETLGRRFPVAAHPRFERLLRGGGVQRFAADCGLPDPYDGLVEGQPEILPVHDCMGAVLRGADGAAWGVLTLDALQPETFAAIAPAQLDAVLRLVESGIASLQANGRQAAARERAAARAARPLRAPREMVGKSAALLALRREIDTVAASDLTVLILGETGVGKELVAQRLHARSPRRDAPLVQLNCAALPETLAESEFFGHRQGAFTGARQDRAGKFELADGGTLFLDEVGELPLAVQAKLLRVLQSGELQRLGSDRLRHVDVRVVCATNRDLRAEVAQGRFRADLYHRLSVFPLRVPPLRERGRDVLALAGFFLEEAQHRLGARNFRLTAAARAALLAHGWPGNIRELEHVINRATLRALAGAGRAARWISIELRHLDLQAVPAAPPVPAAVPLAEPGPPAAPAAGTTLRAAVEDFQRRWIAAALARHRGRLAAAAREAGMDRSNFQRLVRRLGIPLSGAETLGDNPAP